MDSMRREKNVKQIKTAFYEEVIRRNSDMVYRLAYALVKTRDDADDIYQEVFLRYMQNEPDFQNAEHEKAWFLRVTVNCCKNYWKSPWMQRRSGLDDEALEKESLEKGASREKEDADQTLIETVKKLPEK